MDLMLLKCKVAQGQFSSEYAVSGETSHGRGFSLFAPSDSVSFDSEPLHGEMVDGLITVEMLGSDQKSGECLVRLPGQTLENGRTITVKRPQLSTYQRQPQGV